MEKRNESLATQNVDSRIMRRLRFYLIVLILLFAVIVLEIVYGTFSILFTAGGLMIGLVMGVIVSRIYNLTWDAETNNVISSIDWIGLVILVFYLVFLLSKTQIIGYLIQGNLLFAVLMGISAGTMLGRIISTKRGIERILEVTLP